MGVAHVPILSHGPSNSTHQLEIILYQIFGAREEQILVTLALAYLIPFAGMFLLSFWMFGGAPYGRYKPTEAKTREFFGPTMSCQVAWCVQESPAFVWPLVFLFFSEGRQLSNKANLVLLLCFVTHYFHRNFIFSLRKKGKPYEVVFCIMVFFYVFFQVFIVTRYLSQYAVMEDDEMFKPRFILGFIVFITGFVINLHSDHLLINLRKESGDKGYHIPRGGLFEYVSGANFFGETIEWCGFWIAAWNVPALSYFLMTCLNIVPRAFQHHQYYQTKFEDYPKTRKALIPFIL